METPLTQRLAAGATNILLLGLLLMPSGSFGQDEAAVPEAKRTSIFVLPAINFSDDLGFGYGALVQWDDKRSADYQPYYLSHRVLIQRTTRGIADYYYRLDSKYLLPRGLRLTVETRYRVSLFEPYHGLGGAQTRYSVSYHDEDSSDYRGKFYYTYDKRSIQANVLVQGGGERLRWLAGVIHLSTAVDTIDYARHDEDPSFRSLLAGEVALGGVQLAGGRESGLAAGLVWDGRDHETTPTRGIWSEVLLRWVPAVPTNDYFYTVVTATHRHYVPLYRNLTFAYRLSARAMSAGAPFFSVPNIDGSFAMVTGLGGYRTLRGVLWQRAVGRRLFYGNFELRYRLLPLWRSGYLAWSAFLDLGRSFDAAPSASLPDAGEPSDRWHRGVGSGLRLAPHASLVIAFELGWPMEPQLDGPGMKLYIGVDWLF